MSTQNILLVEDDVALAEALLDTLLLANYKAVVVHSAEEAIQKLTQFTPDLIISDINMPGKNGLELLQHVKTTLPSASVLLMTAFGSVRDAVNAIHAGASDYLLKPFEPDELIAKIRQLTKAESQNNNNSAFIAVDKKSKAVLALASKVATTDATVLISGESGTGKEVLARFIHQQSRRAEENFVAINCAAIPENMLEATLFGYEKGAFTGAHQRYTGKFEQAQQGTLLLDEISEMDLNLQAKLLRVLQEKELERLGGKSTIALDVRIIATTNRDIKQAISQGEFREDLFYRLNVFPINWLPLQQRRDDILPLAQYFLQKYAGEYDCNCPTVNQLGEKILVNYAWPGNIREMDNVMQRLVILKRGGEIDVTDLPMLLEQTNTSENVEMKISSLKTQEYSLILQYLQQANGRRRQVAERLGISERTLRYKLAKMRELGMTIPVGGLHDDC